MEIGDIPEADLVRDLNRPEDIRADREVTREDATEGRKVAV